MEDKIKYINNSVVESLQFAETKNAALITFNGAALYVFIEGREYLPTFFQNYVIEWSLFLVAAISISFFAFLPIMNPTPSPSDKEAKQREALKENVSIYYFGHIKLFTADLLLKRIYNYYEVKIPNKFMRSELDLTSQTIMLSRITWRKYFFFNIAGHLTLITLVLPIPFLIVYYLVTHFKKKPDYKG
jgi:hypothetical protein